MRGDPAMAGFLLTKTRFHAGVWEGIVTAIDEAAGRPQILATHLEKPLDGVALTEDSATDGQWILRIPVPAKILADGVQSILIQDARSRERLGSFTIVTGEPLEDDIRAEVDLLRAELDMLKRAFRRHCLETD